MNKDEAVETAVKFLMAIYRSDLDAAATINNAHARYKDEGDTQVLVDALKGVVDFTNDMIDAIQ